VTLTQYTDAEPVNDMAFQDAMEMASNDDQDDDQDDDVEGSTLLAAHGVSGSVLTLEAFTDSGKDQDNALRLDDDDIKELEVVEDDDNETGAYKDTTVGKKRKRVRLEVPETELNHSKITGARIKAEGGESFLLDDDTNMLGHHKRSRSFGTFGRRMCHHPWCVQVQ
jgi:predicted sulfurtransferase